MKTTTARRVLGAALAALAFLGHGAGVGGGADAAAVHGLRALTAAALPGSSGLTKLQNLPHGIARYLKNKTPASIHDDLVREMAYDSGTHREKILIFIRSDFDSAKKFVDTTVQTAVKKNDELAGVAARKSATGGALSTAEAVRLLAKQIDADGPLAVEVGDAARGALALARQVKQFKIEARRLGGTLEIPRIEAAAEYSELLLAFARRQKRFKPVVGGLATGPEGTIVSMAEAKKYHPLLAALKSNTIPEGGVPAEWDELARAAMSDYSKHSKKSGTLSLLLLNKLHAQADPSAWFPWAHKNMLTNADFVLGPTSVRETQRISDALASGKAYNSIGNLPVRPYSQAVP